MVARHSTGLYYKLMECLASTSREYMGSVIQTVVRIRYHYGHQNSTCLEAGLGYNILENITIVLYNTIIIEKYKNIPVSIAIFRFWPIILQYYNLLKSI